VSGGRWVILCQRPIFRMTEFTFSSRTRAALLSANNYEISSWDWPLTASFLLRANCTMMGLLTYTLMYTLGQDDASSWQPVLTWKDTILTYRDLDPLEMSLPIAVRTTLHRWLTSHQEIILPGDGERYSMSVPREMNFLNVCEQGFRGITVWLLNDFFSFANGNSDDTRPSTPEEDENNLWNHLP